MNGWSWLFNRETCQNQGGDLVSIETEEEWKFINDEIQRRNTKYYISTWSIGLTKKAGNWTWVSERPLTICKWGKGEPSGEHGKAIMSSGPVMANRACLVAQLGGNGTLIFVRFPRVSFSFGLFCFVLFFPFLFSYSYSSSSSSTYYYYYYYYYFE